MHSNVFLIKRKDYNFYRHLFKSERLSFLSWMVCGETSGERKEKAKWII